MNSSKYGNDFSAQLDTINARFATILGQKSQAEKLLAERISSHAEQSFEDSLDLMKAFHECGNREKANQVFQSLHSKVLHNKDDNVVTRSYLQQEMKERQSIHFTPKELITMSSEYYDSKRFLPAFKCLSQAFTLAPDNKAVAFAILKTATAIVNQNDTLPDSDATIIERSYRLLDDAVLSPEKQKELDFFQTKLVNTAESEPSLL
jgi:tetratricopeptide (TPR) repeat protein